MKIISGKYRTFMYKNLPLFVALGIGTIFIAFFISELSNILSGKGNQKDLLGASFALFIIFFAYQSIVSLYAPKILMLADNVYDEGDSLLFQFGKENRRVYFTDIVEIDLLHEREEYIYDTLKVLCKFRKSDGDLEVLSFIPQMSRGAVLPRGSFTYKGETPLVRDLRARITTTENSQELVL